METKILLQSLQGSYLRAIVRAMKTTSIMALEIALCIPPLDLAAVNAAKCTAYRLKCLGEWKDTGLGHTKLGLLQKNPFTRRQDRILKKYQLVKHFQTWIPAKEEWLDPGKINNPSVDPWFTDESGIDHCFEAGVYRPKDNYRESIPMGSYSTVFSAEILTMHGASSEKHHREKNKYLLR
ncbi:reverse transcriptase [Lasius niger]|uniref:Reverse transcriptase n=1 Tax=Lasius niger TaxID=67767 RepID=A0A0J7KG31_LASNI|nr:reverse transcriptase [Lasius niger]